MRNLLQLVARHLLNTQAPPRSPEWPAVRHAHLVKEGFCRACGGTVNLEVHHIVPVHVARSLELDPTNLITLCERAGWNCHLRWGHLGWWLRWNKDIRQQAIAPAPGVAAPGYHPNQLPPWVEVDDGFPDEQRPSAPA